MGKSWVNHGTLLVISQLAKLAIEFSGNHGPLRLIYFDDLPKLDILLFS
jgi:hypothetical protein